MSDSIVDNLLKSFIEDIKFQIKKTQHEALKKVNKELLGLYWSIGKQIVSKQEQYGWGKEVVKTLSNELRSEFVGLKGFSVQNLWNMRQYYLEYKDNQKLQTLSREIGWSHNVAIFQKCKDELQREFYIKSVIKFGWSYRVLDNHITNQSYEKYLLNQNNFDKTLDKQTYINQAKLSLKDEYNFSFLDLPTQSLLESNIEQALIDNLQKFLLELGRGFAFVARQQRLQVEEQDFYIDLVFYNFKLKCFLLIDLKLAKLTHQDVGQMDTYVRVYDKFYKSKDDNPTVGLILCSEDSKAVAKYSVLKDSEQLFSSKYLPFLPTKEELEATIQKERLILEELKEENEVEFKGSPKTGGYFAK